MLLKGYGTGSVGGGRSCLAYWGRMKRPNETWVLGLSQTVGYVMCAPRYPHSKEPHQEKDDLGGSRAPHRYPISSLSSLRVSPYSIRKSAIGWKPLTVSTDAKELVAYD